LLIKYIKSVLWRVAKCLSYIEEARCLKVNIAMYVMTPFYLYMLLCENQTLDGCQCKMWPI